MHTVLFNSVRLASQNFTSTLCFAGKIMGSRVFTMRQVNTRISCRLFSSKVYDVAIAGGGIMGLATAYFLAARTDGKKICVIEKDPSYTKASTVLSVASIRQQFSLPENVLLSKSTYQFFDEIQSHLSVNSEEEVDIQFKEGGYLILAGENGLGILQQNYKLQRSLDCSIDLLTPRELKEKCPWMNTEDVAMASLGTASEGWFDPWLLLTHFKKKILSMGVKYINGEVTDIKTDQHGLVSGINVTSYRDTEDSETIACKYLINSSGAWAGQLASKLGIYLPVEPRKRNVFVLDCPNGPKFNFAFVVDRSGLYIRYEGGHYITGMSPDAERDTKSDDLTVDYEYFEETMWPILANRIPAFEKLKVKSAWAGFYDYNTFDQNAVIGFHPVVRNFIFINGFSGHGMQQCAAAGRAVSELILDGKFTTIDLTRLGYERILAEKPFKELNVI